MNGNRRMKRYILIIYEPRWCSTKWFQHTKNSPNKKFVYTMTLYRFSIFMIALLYCVSVVVVVCVSGHIKIYDDVVMYIVVITKAWWQKQTHNCHATFLFACESHSHTSQSKRTFYIILKNRKQTCMKIKTNEMNASLSWTRDVLIDNGSKTEIKSDSLPPPRSTYTHISMILF